MKKNAKNSLRENQAPIGNIIRCIGASLKSEELQLLNFCLNTQGSDMELVLKCRKSMTKGQTAPE